MLPAFRASLGPLKNLVRVSTTATPLLSAAKPTPLISVAIPTPLAAAAAAFSTSAPRPVKSIVEVVDSKATVVEGVRKQKSGRRFVCLEDFRGRRRSMLHDPNFFQRVSHTDVLILCQFLKSNNTVMPRSVTRLPQRSHDRLVQLVKKAQRANLIPTTVKPLRDTIPFKGEARFGFYDPRKVNSYYSDFAKLY